MRACAAAAWQTWFTSTSCLSGSCFTDSTPVLNSSLVLNHNICSLVNTKNLLIHNTSASNSTPKLACNKLARFGLGMAGWSKTDLSLNRQCPEPARASTTPLNTTVGIYTATSISAVRHQSVVKGMTNQFSELGSFRRYSREKTVSVAISAFNLLLQCK